MLGRWTASFNASRWRSWHVPREKPRVFKVFCWSGNFKRPISRQPLGRLTCGNFCKVVASLLLNIRYSHCMWVTPTARAKCNNKRCQICSFYNNSAITAAISLKLGMYIGRHSPGNAFLCVTIRVLLHVHTCRGASRSRERLGPLSSNLVRG